MKRFSVVLVLLAALMCISTGMAVAQSSLPDLTGKWKAKSYSHHHEKKGFYTNTQVDGQWVIKEQQGRHFFGERTAVRKHIGNKKVSEGFSGVISRDGKRVYVVDHDEGFMIGDILSNDSIEFVLIDEPEKGLKNHDSTIGLIEIERVK